MGQPGVWALTIWPHMHCGEVDSGNTIVKKEILASLLGPRGSLAGLGIIDNVGVPSPEEALAANGHLQSEISQHQRTHAL